MALIKKEAITELLSAADVRAVAESALAEHEKMSVAALINEAANCGETSVVCDRYLSDAMKSELKSQGYTVIHPDQAYQDTMPISIISWE